MCYSYHLLLCKLVKKVMNIIQISSEIEHLMISWEKNPNPTEIQDQYQSE